MSYTTNMPLAAQKINNTTTLIRNNFNELFTQLQNDHVSINDATPGNRLTHKQVTLNVGAVPTTAASQVAVYAKQVAGITELFMRRESNGSEIALSTGGLTPNKVANGGYTFLPGGLVDMWGTITIGNAALALPNPGAAVISAIYNIQITPSTITDDLLCGIVSYGPGNSFTPYCRRTNGTPGLITVRYRAVVAV